METARVELEALSQDFVTMFRLGRVRPTSRGELVMVYSFGPNHRRESTEWEVGGDDIAAIIEYRSSPSSGVPEGR